MGDNRDGFVVRGIDGNEVSFIACDKGGSTRERVEMGLLRNMDIDRFFVEDTRDSWGDRA